MTTLACALAPAVADPVPDAAAAPGVAPPKPARATPETILDVRRFTPALLSVRVSRDRSFRFAPGRYARVGLPGAGETVFRPLSIASAPADPHLEFLCTRVEGGAFSARLDAVRAGDPVEVEKACFGFLTIDTLAPGTDLWLLASGTGLGPFLSMLRDSAVWQSFDRIVLAHSVRHAAELAFGDELRRLADGGPGAPARARLAYLPVVTREPGATVLSQRIPALLADGRLAAAAGATLDPARSRVMACGNPEMTRELRALLGERGFRTSRRGAPGQVAFEKYW